MDTKEYWKKIHKKYAVQKWINKPTIFAKSVVKYFPKDGKLLELGAGQGQDSIYFAKKGYRVLSTDLLIDTLSILKNKTLEEGIVIKTKELDLNEKLPFKNKSFDIVYSHLAIHYFKMSRTKKLMKEISNILKPNGIFAMLLNTMDDPEVEEFEQIENGLYMSPQGLMKRYFTTKDVELLTRDHFERIILDNKGETYKDEIKTLIRFVGKKF